MMVWLIDSRSRALTGKRYVWGWDEDDTSLPVIFRMAWTIVLNAEPWVDDAFWEEAAAREETFEEGQKRFRLFWAEYGWEILQFDESFLDVNDSDMVRQVGHAVKIPRFNEDLIDEPCPWMEPPYR